MTLYISPMHHARRRRMIDEMLRDWDGDYSNELTFPIDVAAESDFFTIKALLPGVKADDLNIQIVNEIVTISGEITIDRDEDSNYLLAELPSGKFHRMITLPTPLDPTEVSANLENGVLTLQIPKAEEAKPRTIKVNAN